MSTPVAASLSWLRSWWPERARDLGLDGVWVAVCAADPTTAESTIEAAAFGGDAERQYAPNAVLRLGSVSKVVTATAVLRLAEAGRLDLDADVRRYLPEFAPGGLGANSITLRQLLCHRSGLPREAPVGHLADAGEPTLRATVASLGRSELVQPPGVRFGYSNAGYAVLGEVIARVTGQPFAAAVRELVFDPLQLTDLDFELRRDFAERRPPGRQWTYDGRTIPVPTFAFGEAPAVGLAGTLRDLARLASSWFPRAEPRLLERAALERMWQPGDAGDGFGCFVDRLRVDDTADAAGAADPEGGPRRVRHDGAVDGFAVTLMALPDHGLAVAVGCNRDFATAVTADVAERLLRQLLVVRRGHSLPPPVWPQRVGVAAARALAGRYELFDYVPATDGVPATAGYQPAGFEVRLLERGGELVYDPDIGVRTRLRLAAGEFVADDLLAIGGARRLTLGPDGGAPWDGERSYGRLSTPPPPCPDELRDLLGEYGWPHDAVIVYEDRGRIAVLLDWVGRYLPQPVGPDRYRFLAGAYDDHELRFERDATGVVVGLWLGSVWLPRRPAPDVSFRIAPVMPVSTALRAARAATPPPAPAGATPSDLVELAALDATLRFDLRYATADNFVGARLYERPIARLQRPAALALLRAQGRLGRHGLGLVVYDAYRPWFVTKAFWDVTPPSQHDFVADPANGSRHNRGCAVDVGLVDLLTGTVVEMPSGFDEFTERAYPDYPGGTALARWHRELLRTAMEAEGFTVYDHEWWHFDFAGWQGYAVGNTPL